jgi:uncharacterized membrane protein
MLFEFLQLLHDLRVGQMILAVFVAAHISFNPKLIKYTPWFIGVSSYLGLSAITYSLEAFDAGITSLPLIHGASVVLLGIGVGFLIHKVRADNLKIRKTISKIRIKEEGIDDEVASLLEDING